MASFTFVKMGAIMVRLYASAGVRGIDVKGIEMRADLLDRIERLIIVLRQPIFGTDSLLEACFTWATEAPACKTWLVVDRGLPEALFVTFSVVSMTRGAYV